MKTPKDDAKDKASKEIISQYEESIGLSGISYSIKERADGPHLIFYIYKPTERFFSSLNQLNETLPEDNPFFGHLGLVSKTEEFSLNSPEVKSLQLSLSESLTVGRDSFQDEFFARYIDSGSGAEQKIQADANHIVFGRRGAGKSSLLIYAMRTLEKKKHPYVWIDMQVYEKREDNGVIVGILIEMLGQIKELISDSDRIFFEKLLRKLETFRNEDNETKIESIRKLAIDFKSLLKPIATESKKLVIFLDDLHVIKKSLQPNLLSFLYSFSRGNKIFLKISAVQNFTKSFDSANRVGLEIPNDAQTISLDLNLTTPDRAGEHIENILNAYAIFSGGDTFFTIPLR